LTELAASTSYVYRFFASNEDPATAAWSEAGTITTAEPGQRSFELYLAPFGLAETAAHPGADPEGDALTNLEEFAFGLDPSSQDNAALRVHETKGIFTAGTPTTAVSPDRTQVRVRFVRRMESAASGISYTMQFSSDLVAWQIENATPAVLLQNTKTGYEVVEVTYPRPAEEAALFHRLLLTLHP
jgi:hypothetical protein